jgi:hypothetical protein
MLLTRGAGTVDVQSFANFSTALHGGMKKTEGIVDYSKQALSTSDEARQKVLIWALICHMTFAPSY